MDDCQRCNMPEQYGCGCTPQEMNKWRAEKIIALQAENDRLRAEIATARRDALEEAAKVADLSWQRWKGNRHGLPVVECDVTACDNIAAAIRALIAQEEATP